MSNNNSPVLEELNQGQPVVDASSYLERYLNRYGWMSDQPSGGTYKPTTTQERDFILGYLQSTGRAPTNQEIHGWRTQAFSNTPQEQLTFTPETRLYQQGHRNYGDYQAALEHGERFGTYAGSAVPEGGTVLTRNNRPWIRTFRPERYSDQLGAGEYLPSGSNIEGAAPSRYTMSQEERERYYPTYSHEMFGGYTQDPFSVFAPSQVYGARLEDYLNQLIERDAPIIENLVQVQNSLIDEWNNYEDNVSAQYSSGRITEDEAVALREGYRSSMQHRYDSVQEQIDALFAEDKRDETLAQAQDRIGHGVYDETLPFYAEVQNIMGEKTNELLNFGIQQLDEIERERIANIPTFEGYDRIPATTPIETTGREQTEYYSLIESMGVGNEWKDWLSSRFHNYYNEWRKSGSGVPFMNWVLQYLAR